MISPFSNFLYRYQYQYRCVAFILEIVFHVWMKFLLSSSFLCMRCNVINVIGGPIAISWKLIDYLCWSSAIWRSSLGRINQFKLLYGCFLPLSLYLYLYPSLFLSLYTYLLLTFFVLTFTCCDSYKVCMYIYENPLCIIFIRYLNHLANVPTQLHCSEFWIWCVRMWLPLHLSIFYI